MLTNVQQSFPLEKIFGSRTRIKVITLFTTGTKRPYYVREIARTVDERLNAVRRELEILRRVGMLTTRMERRRKFYTLNPQFIITSELTSIMQKVGPGIKDTLFKNVERLGDIKYMCLSGYFTSAQGSSTDLLIIGTVHERRLQQFIQQVEQQLNREITYTPMTENEYRYRRNFNDIFLRQIFSQPYKEILNKLPQELQPTIPTPKTSSVLMRTKVVPEGS